MKPLLLVCFLITFCTPVSAGVIIHGTRVIFHGSHVDESLSVTNTEKSMPFLVQSWVSEFPNSSDKTDKNNFIITPPLFRIEPGESNILRINLIGSSLPQGRESIFLLNVKSIPQVNRALKNQFVVTMKSSIKMIYRPSDIDFDSAESAYEKLKFSLSGTRLLISNPSRYYITLNNLTMGGESINLDKQSLIPPMTSVTYLLSKEPTLKYVTWQAIGDLGQVTKTQQTKI